MAIRMKRSSSGCIPCAIPRACAGDGAFTSSAGEAIGRAKAPTAPAIKVLRLTSSVGDPMQSAPMQSAPI